MSLEVTGLDMSRKRPVESSDRPSCVNLERSTSSNDAASKKSDKSLTRSSLNSPTEGAKEDKEMSTKSDIVSVIKLDRHDLTCPKKRKLDNDPAYDDIPLPSYPSGTVVAVGYYGRPKELEKSCSEFPCVKAFIVGLDRRPSVGPIEFVIDTLSESVTLTKENFNLCEKKFLTRRTINCPNNLSYEDDIYVGNIVLGGHLFEIETSCDTVNSLPSKLFSIFDHVVTQGRHYWIWPGPE